MSKDNFYLSEIYSAIQGEGPLVGIRQIFVRFSACDLRCLWCDTPDSLVRTEYCEIEKNAGARDFNKVKNPIELYDLISFISNLSPKLHHSISFTGGEPLLQSESLLSLIPLIKERFLLPIYLESGGHRPDKLKKIVHLLDYISMDFKLPTSSETSPMWDKHKEFLNISLEAKKNVWVKIIVTNDTSFDELLYSLHLIKSVNKKVEMFLQPVTKINGSRPPSEKNLLNIHSRLLEHYPYVRVLPQVHKLIGQR